MKKCQSTHRLEKAGNYWVSCLKELGDHSLGFHVGRRPESLRQLWDFVGEDRLEGLEIWPEKLHRWCDEIGRMEDQEGRGVSS